MDSPGSSNIDIELCQLCSSRPQKYTCPRCSTHYCSVECYKSTPHWSCSEEFYKECVEDEMKSQSNNPEDRKKMIEILKRFHAESYSEEFDDQGVNYHIPNQQEGSDESIDSDDDKEVEKFSTLNLNYDLVPDLSERIANVDLDNADDLWTVLTDAEKQEFEAIIRNGDMTKLLPQWTPWWSKTIDGKLIEIISSEEKINYLENCPHLVEISPINAVEKASPLMCYNLLNVLNAYAFMVLHYNGEHKSSALEAIALFLQLNDVIGGSAIFEDALSAFTSVKKKAVDCELIPKNSDGVMILNSIKQIVRGPCEKHRNHYVAAALSDLHQLFTEVKSKCHAAHEINLNSTMPHILKSNIQSIYSKLTKKLLQLYIKKVEFYLAWNYKYGMRMHDLDLNEIKQSNDSDFE